MSIELVLTSALGLVSTLFGGGLLRQAFTHSNALAIQKHELDQLSLKVESHDQALRGLTTDVALVNRDVEGFANQVKKLELLPEINGRLSSLETLLAYIQKQLSRNYTPSRSNHSDDN